MPLRRNDAAAVEITALAAGAGPPAKRIATRRIGLWRGADLGSEGEAEGMAGELPFTFRSNRPAGRLDRSGGYGGMAPGSVAGTAPGFCAFIQRRGRDARIPHRTH